MRRIDADSDSHRQKTIAPHAASGKAWMEAQKDALKTGRVEAVLSALAPHREAPCGLDVIDTPRVHREELPPRALDWRVVRLSVAV